MLRNQCIEVQLRKRFEGFDLQVDLQLPGQGVTVLFGHSGSGKTSLLRCIAGLERAEGRVLVRGETWQDEQCFVPTHQRPLGYVFQQASLFAHLSVEANLHYGRKRVPPSQLNVSLQHAIDLLGIGHLLRRRPERLSGGERQRVAIAQALALSPRVLMMDEPLAALDQARKAEILPYLERLHQQLDIPLLYVTHSTDELSRLADYLVVLEQGRVLASGALADVQTELELPLKLGEEAGVVIEARIATIDAAHYLARFDFAGGSLWARDPGLPIGAVLRLRVLARDVSLALEPVSHSSIVNVLPAKVEAIADTEHAAIKLVRTRVGETKFLCRLTARSVAHLNLRPQQSLWLQVKSVAVIE